MPGVADLGPVDSPASAARPRGGRLSHRVKGNAGGRRPGSAAKRNGYTLDAVATPGHRAKRGSTSAAGGFADPRNVQQVPTLEDLPRYRELMLPVLRAVEQLGGSATSREIIDAVIAGAGLSDEVVAFEYPGRPKSVFIDRVEWARSYCKLGGVIESPKRGLFLMTELGREIAALPDDQASARLDELDRLVRSTSRNRTKTTETDLVDDDEPAVTEDVEEESGEWKEQLLRRLHRLTPRAFEEFCIYLLRRYGLELTHVGGSGDEGIDAIGTAPMSAILSATVAVQAKRYEPSTTIAREQVALFQRDASAKGAERAVMITLGRYSEPAKKAATTATPTVDLIGGDRLVELIREQEIGVKIQPVVDEDWFDRFER